jgi:hypothetical protein
MYSTKGGSSFLPAEFHVTNTGWLASQPGGGVHWRLTKPYRPGVFNGSQNSSHSLLFPSSAQQYSKWGPSTWGSRTQFTNPKIKALNNLSPAPPIWGRGNFIVVAVVILEALSTMHTTWIQDLTHGRQVLYHWVNIHSRRHGDWMETHRGW